MTPTSHLLPYKHLAMNRPFPLLCLALGITKYYPGPSFSMLEIPSPVHAHQWHQDTQHLLLLPGRRWHWGHTAAGIDGEHRRSLQEQ